MLFGLVFLLVGCEKHIIRKRSTSDCTLGSHRMTFASKRAGTLDAIFDKHTTLPFYIDRACRKRVNVSVDLVCWFGRKEKRSKCCKKVKVEISGINS